jgi:thiol-disulfide isomerase/thioredoxin
LKRIVIIAGLMILSAGMAVSMSQTGGKVHAPDFPGGAQWINSKPLKMADLRGKIVLLDFWTYACINCIHIIPDLKKLEQKYKNEMVVIGVHSAKFTTEKDSQNILAAVQRYGIKHPVINDNKLRMWYEYAVRAWPTVVLINPEGYISLVRSGEGVYEPLDKAIGEMVTEFSKKGELNTQPVNFELEDTVVSKSPLRFPGKIAIDDIGKRLFITDSNNNRVVILKTDGETIQTIGSGEQGFADGFFLAAKFNHPQADGYYICRRYGKPRYSQDRFEGPDGRNHRRQRRTGQAVQY